MVLASAGKVRVSIRILLNVKEGTSSLTQKKCKLFRDMLKDTKMEEYPVLSNLFGPA